MRQKEEISALGRVLEVRQIQRQAAEMKLARRNEALRNLSDNRSEALRRLLSDHQSWSRSISGRLFELEASRAWLAAIEAGEAALNTLDGQLSVAEAEVAQAKRELFDAIGRLDVADDLERSARRRLLRSQEETALNQVDDRSARLAVSA